MSATEELRRMLDKCVVEWAASDESWNPDIITYWKVGSIKWVAFEKEEGTLWLNCNSVTDLTPEQAIAATVPHAASTYAALLQESKARMNLQRDYNDQSVRIHNQRKQLREMQEALERGKCRNLDSSGYGFKCSGCGHTRTQSGEIDPTEWDYCPSCGRKVV